MTIKQALKYKNKLVKRINEAFQKVYTYNTVEEGQTRPYDVKESLNEYLSLTNELIDLKSAIHTANLPVYHKIFQLSELKSQVSKINLLSCEEGKISDRYSRMTEGAPLIKTSTINIVERDRMVKDLEAQIEQIQEELDVHNATTNIG